MADWLRSAADVIDSASLSISQARSFAADAVAMTTSRGLTSFAATQRSILDALEARYPMLRGTIRDHGTQRRRAFVRFFACEQDLSHDPPDAPLPDVVASGAEPFMIIGAMAGGEGWWFVYRFEATGLLPEERLLHLVRWAVGPRPG